MRRWQERYATLLGAALVIGVVVQPAVSALTSLARHADPARLGAGLALAAVAYAGYLALVRAAGPMVVSAADASWRLLSPLPRRTVLGRAALVALAVSVLAGLALGVAVTAALGAPDRIAVRLTAGLVLGVAGGVGGMALGVLGQSSPAWDGWLQGLIGATLLAAVVLAVLGTGPGRHLLTAVASAPAGLAAAAAGAAAAVTAVLVRRAWRALDGMPARAVLAASARTGRAAQAAVMLDPGALTWTAEDGRWRGRALRSRPWPVRGAAALAWQEARRAGRWPGRFAVLAGAAALPALTVAAGHPGAGAALAAAGAFAAAASVTTGARRDFDNPALPRLLAVGPRAALAARALPPALLGAVWSAAALAGMSAAGALPGGPWWPLGLCCGPALAAGALRMARRRPVDHSLAVIDSPGGGIPLGPVLWAVTGADLAVLGCAPALTALLAPPADPLPYVAAQAVTGLAVLGAYLLKAGRRPR
ncbi:DUF6297 family protein [Bailinhaonella thermotolerans]|uniref:ABC-2 type transport system permease protein n=1 Tax=Bailinhaonella thermotolerans TaxID=1070861 RepID=A0A3A4AZF2_9ACTN|nr:DUF6297 family protein [Bailinhaonella thermotolerans]RJL24752.1 hypothetical protein D5H75_28605 [Bailinhaonella thermotolerans]